MRRWKLTTGIIMVLLLASIIGAQPHHGSPGMGNKPCGRHERDHSMNSGCKHHSQKGKGGGWMLHHEPSKLVNFLKENAPQVNVKGEEIEEIENVIYESKKKMINLRSKKEKLKLKLHRVKNQDEIDKSKVMGVVEDLNSVKGNMRKERIETRLDIIQVLGTERLDNIKDELRKRHLEMKRGNGGHRSGCPKERSGRR